MHTINSTDSLTDKVRERLFAEGAFRDNPLTESHLAEFFHVSRTPVRDALKELEKEGIVERRKKKGVYLKIPSAAEIAEAYDVRSVLEGFASNLAVENIDGRDLEQLGRLAQKYTKSMEQGNYEAAGDADRQFHGKIVQLSNNTLLAGMMDNFRVLERTFKARLPRDKRNSQLVSPYSHQRVVEALQAGDPKECEQIMRAHIQWSKKRMLENALGFKLGGLEVT